MTDSSPFFSIIVPAHNAGPNLDVCLRSIHESQFRDWELIVVDDGSTDSTAERAQCWTEQVIVNPQRRGPAAARNRGAKEARGRYLFFTDADCQFHPDTLCRAAQALRADPGLDALFGSYDDAPAASNFLSQYKNLLHHYTHQTSREEAHTFWAGCGAIRRETFLALDGFDAVRYPQPSVEDIELGYRLVAAGGRIRLAKTVQVKHLKWWTWTSLLFTDIWQRAIPWSQLLLERLDVPAELNLQEHHRLSALALLVAAGGGIMMLLSRQWKREQAMAVRSGPTSGQQLRGAEMRSERIQRIVSSATTQRNAGLASLLALIWVLWLNRDLYRFLTHRRGWRFTLLAVLWHWLYYGYSGVAFVCVWLWARIRS